MPRHWFIDGAFNLWNPDKKTVFDPCPEGYRVARHSFMYIINVVGCAMEYAIASERVLLYVDAISVLQDIDGYVWIYEAVERDASRPKGSFRPH